MSQIVSHTAPRSLYELTEQELAYVNRVRGEEVTFHHWLKKKKNAPENATRYLDLTINDSAPHWVDVSQQIRSNFDAQHEGGWKSWTKTSELFIAGAAQFMQDFKPLVEFAASSGYGGLATGTLGALFAIAQSKSRNDDIISTALGGVRDRLPGYAMLREIYLDPELQQRLLRTKILLAYSGIIELAIASAKYYLRPGISRWWLATWDPEKFTRLAAKVQGYVVAVRHKCEELLNFQVDEIRKKCNNSFSKLREIQAENANLLSKLSEVQAENANLLSKMDEVQVDHDNNSLLMFQEILGLTDWSIERKRRDLRDYGKDLERTIDRDHHFEWMDSKAVAQYKNSNVYLEWRNAHEPCMLLLIGSHHKRISSSYHCWTSPLAVDLIHNPPSRDAKLVFYVFEIEERTSMHKAISEILLQLLRQCLPAVRKLDNKANVYAKLQKYRTKPAGNPGEIENEDAGADLEEAAAVIIKLFEPQESVCVILDRIDRCDRAHQGHLLRVFVMLMEKASCCLKIFAVAHEAFWDVDIFFEPDLKTTLAKSKLRQDVKEQQLRVRYKI